MNKGLRLNLGAAKNIRSRKDGWINCDIKQGPGIDERFDANGAFPFEDGYFDEIYASHIFEHLTDFPNAVKECARVLKKGGVMEVKVPYGVGYHSYDPYHVRYFFTNAFDYFCRGNAVNTTLETDWEQALFELKSCEVIRIVRFRGLLSKVLGKWVERRYSWPPVGIKVEIKWLLRRS